MRKREKECGKSSELRVTDTKYTFTPICIKMQQLAVKFLRGTFAGKICAMRHTITLCHPSICQCVTPSLVHFLPMTLVSYIVFCIPYVFMHTFRRPLSLIISNHEPNTVNYKQNWKQRQFSKFRMFFQCKYIQSFIKFVCDNVHVKLFSELF